MLKCQLCGREFKTNYKHAKYCEDCVSQGISIQMHKNILEQSPELSNLIKNILTEREFPHAIGGHFIRYETAPGYGIEREKRFFAKVGAIMKEFGYAPPKGKNQPYRRIE